MGKEYGSKLILFPKKLSKPHKGDATKEEMDVATQLVSKQIIPVAEVVETEAPREITEDEAKFSAYQTLRKARAHKRLHKFRVTMPRRRPMRRRTPPRRSKKTKSLCQRLGQRISLDVLCRSNHGAIDAVGPHYLKLKCIDKKINKDGSRYSSELKFASFI